MNLFFGDSLTSGENNNYKGYVEYLKELYHKKGKNLGVSGTCIGDYSLYPVGDTNLIQLLYKNVKNIKKADKIFLEYGSNDVSSICASCTPFRKVEIELNKCINFITQTNPKAEIYFITLGQNVETEANGQCAYLAYDYLHNMKILTGPEFWKKLYAMFVDFIETLPVFIITLPLLTKDELDTDNMHPNDAGYRKIAETVKKVL